MASASEQAYRSRWRIGMRMPSRFPCRCTACGSRRVLARHPDEYTRQPPRCLKPRCPSRAWRVDWFRIVTEWHTTPCNCGEYSFPHARGRGYCQHNTALPIEQRRERWESGAWA